MKTEEKTLQDFDYINEYGLKYWRKIMKTEEKTLQDFDYINEYDHKRHTIIFTDVSVVNLRSDAKCLRQNSCGWWFSYERFHDAVKGHIEFGYECVQTKINEKSYNKIFSAKAFQEAIQHHLNTDFAEAELRRVAHRELPPFEEDKEYEYATMNQDHVDGPFLKEGVSDIVFANFKLEDFNNRIPSFKVPTPITIITDFVFGGEECFVSFGCGMEKPVKDWVPDQRASINGMVGVDFTLHLASILQRG